MPHKRKNKDFNPNKCGVTHFLNRIGGKWKVLIVYGISVKVNRFSLLQKAIPAISKQTLVNQLRELEDDNIIQRAVFAGIPLKVEYALTEYGKTLLPVIRYIEDWGSKDMKKDERGCK
ncbi:MAG: helix-turn-helix domain-containing protein [Chitinophagaceae bacterium]